ncbi:MAG: response regulator transcription factor [Myxococcales bacterium]|nr:response regulator transcription factor [Myxococcales bacterium]
MSNTSPGGHTILVVDDDPPLREVVRYALTREGFRVLEAADGVAALAAVEAHDPDLLVLDVSMPELDGFSLCRTLRARSDVPILFLSSRADELDRVLGLELGGDDYVTKPFSTRELVTRVKVILRRPRAATPAAASPDHETLARGPLRLDPEAHRVWADGQEVSLTATEFRLLEVLMRRPSRVFTREELGARAYPDARHVSGRTLDSHVRRIRQKLRDVGVDAIETVHGVGYRMREEDARR